MSSCHLMSGRLALICTINDQGRFQESVDDNVSSWDFAFGNTLESVSQSQL